VPDAVSVTFMDENAFGAISASWALIIIFGIIVMFKVFKMLLEIAERYVILGLLTICAPLAFGVGGSRSTSDIFSGWCRMFASMCVMMVSNVIFFKMLLSVLSVIPSGLDVLPWMVLVLTIPKVAKKVDAIITRIGLNPAITGDSLGSRLPGMLAYTVIRAATKQVVQTAGKNAGGGARGGAASSPSGGGPGGKPNAGSPFGSSKRRGQGSGTAAGSSYPGNPTLKGGQPHGAASAPAPGAAASARQETAQPTWAPQQGAARPGSAGQERANRGADRRSSVPPGTGRFASHVRQQASGTAGTGAASMRGESAAAQNRGVSASSPTGSRFTQAVRQSSRGGDSSTAQHNSQQQNIAVAGPVSGQQRDNGTAGTRFTAQSPQMEHVRNGTAGIGSAGTQHAAPSDTASAVRHGRNGAQTPAGAQTANTAAARQTARQERVPSKMNPGNTSGTAGMSGYQSGQAIKKPSTAFGTERARAASAPSAAAGGKRMTSSATAQQEKAQASARQSSIKSGGDGHAE
jgi:hypothetical protein